MKERLPVEIENRELPVNLRAVKQKAKSSLGYVNGFAMVSIMTIIVVLMGIILMMFR